MGPDQRHDYWRHPEFDRLAIAARFAADEGVRADAYRKMTAIFLEHNPWIVVVQPFAGGASCRALQLEIRRLHQDLGVREGAGFRFDSDEQTLLPC